MNRRVTPSYGLLLMMSGALSLQADEYYSSDLYRAIEQARISTHHYDYSQPLRYNRSTALSIPLDPLLNQELSTTLIEAPVAVDIAKSPDLRPPTQSPNERPTLTNKENRVLALPSTEQRPVIGTPNPVSVTVR